jgi:predicted O-methyltransferase YrrM
MRFSEFWFSRMRELSAMRDGATNATRVPGLLDLLAVTKPQSVLEIGCFTGISTEVFLLHCAHVTAVDCWDAEYIKVVFEGRTALYPGLTVVHGRSPEALHDLKWGSFDLCYIDGDHRYEAVRDDILACKSLVRPGGYIGGHDYGWYDCPGVAPAVHDFLRKPDYVFDDTSWVVAMTTENGL